jgi:hypothetical protein
MPLTRTGVVRLRPGDRPVPVDVALSAAQIRAVRECAHGARLGADALIALLVERRSIIDLVGEHLFAQASERARLAEDRVAPPELRSWQRLLAGLGAPAPDDLPTVYLPLRLASALTQAGRAKVVVDVLVATEAEVEQAVLFEKAATSRGLTMQTWLLASFLA